MSRMTDASREMTATADIYDAHGEDLQSCSVQFRHFGGRTTRWGDQHSQLSP